MQLADYRKIVSEVLRETDTDEKVNRLRDVFFQILLSLPDTERLATLEALFENSKIKAFRWDRYIKIALSDDTLYRDVKDLLQDEKTQDYVYEILFAVFAEMECRKDIVTLKTIMQQSEAIGQPAPRTRGELGTPQANYIIDIFAKNGYITQAGGVYNWNESKRLFCAFAVKMNEFLGIGNKWEIYTDFVFPKSRNHTITAKELSSMNAKGFCCGCKGEKELISIFDNAEKQYNSTNKGKTQRQIKQ